MATIKQYVKNLRDAQYDVALKFGTDLSMSDAPMRALMLSNLTVTAILMKSLVDKGVITDAELKATLDQVRQAVYNREPVDATGWDDVTPVTGV